MYIRFSFSFSFNFSKKIEWMKRIVKKVSYSNLDCKKIQFKMNALQTTFRTSRVTFSTISRNASNFKNKTPLVNINVNVRCEEKHKKDLEKYIQYRNDCWKRHNDLLNKIDSKKRRKTIIVECNDLNEWETEKALEHAFKN